MPSLHNAKFLGVYSRSAKTQSGKSVKYFVWQLANATCAIQELDGSLSAKGPVTAISNADLNSLFKSEPSILAVPVTTPDFRKVIKPQPVREAPVTDDLGQLEKARKAKQIENDLRESFKKALRALARPRDRKGAITALERIAASKEGIMPAHRHMFRDFGVMLRKKSLPEIALICAKKVVSLSPMDDHARFNLARIHTLLGQYEEANKELKKAMQIDPGEPVYNRLERHIEREMAFALEKQQHKKG